MIIPPTVIIPRPRTNTRSLRNSVDWNASKIFSSRLYRISFARLSLHAVIAFLVYTPPHSSAETLFLYLVTASSFFFPKYTLKSETLVYSVTWTLALVSSQYRTGTPVPYYFVHYRSPQFGHLPVLTHQAALPIHMIATNQGGCSQTLAHAVSQGNLTHSERSPIRLLPHACSRIAQLVSVALTDREQNGAIMPPLPPRDRNPFSIIAPYIADTCPIWLGAHLVLVSLFGFIFPKK